MFAENRYYLFGTIVQDTVVAPRAHDALGGREQRSNVRVVVRAYGVGDFLQVTRERCAETEQVDDGETAECPTAREAGALSDGWVIGGMRRRARVEHDPQRPWLLELPCPRQGVSVLAVGGENAPAVESFVAVGSGVEEDLITTTG